LVAFVQKQLFSLEDLTLLEQGSFIQVAAGSLDSGLHNMKITANDCTTWTMNVEEFPWMRYNPKGDHKTTDAWRSGKPYMAIGSLSIRDVRKDVKFFVSFDPAAMPGQDVVKLRIEATIDRIAFDVAPYWPTFLLDKDVKVTASLTLHRDRVLAKKPPGCMHGCFAWLPCR